MAQRNLLLLSSSRVGDTDYLQHASNWIQGFFQQAQLSENAPVVFVPFAGVSIGYADYTKKVAAALAKLNLNIINLAASDDPLKSVKQAEAIMVGGGNTFHLLHQLYQFDLVGAIREAVNRGIPYLGWSAGSNIAAPSIKTTNDMPIVQPPSFQALNLVPFQINPHYIDQHPAGFNGETRDDRLGEFMTVAPETKILGLPEGTGLKVTQNSLELLGELPVMLFHKGQKTEADQQQLQAIYNREVE